MNSMAKGISVRCLFLKASMMAPNVKEDCLDVQAKKIHNEYVPQYLHESAVHASRYSAKFLLTCRY